MDRWKYYGVGHQHHVICNPQSEAKLDELVDLLAIPVTGRLLDIACGKGELLRRAARRFSCRGVGVELSAWEAPVARAANAEAGLADAIEIVHGDGAEYDGAPASFDASVCLGASWIWKGFAGTLDALASWTRPGGVVVSGEPFWRREPSPEYLAHAGMERGDIDTHAGNIETAEQRGLRPLRAIVSSDDDWDRYESLQWHAVETYAHAHPDDPDVPELLETVHRARHEYLTWGREQLGWAVYVFLKP